MFNRKNKATPQEKEMYKKKLEEVNLAIQQLEGQGLTVPQTMINSRNFYLNKLNTNKYNAKKSSYNGLEFDSELEMEYAKFLDSLKIPFKHQVKFVLQDAFRLQIDEFNDEPIREITYTADFEISSSDGTKKIIIDIKGNKATQTEEFNIKWKMLKFKYREQYKYIKIENKSQMASTLGIIKNYLGI